MPYSFPCYQRLGSRLASMNIEEGWELEEEIAIYTSYPSCSNLSSYSPKMPVIEIRNKNNLKRDPAVQSGMRNIPEVHC